MGDNLLGSVAFAPNLFLFRLSAACHFVQASPHGRLLLSSTTSSSIFGQIRANPCTVGLGCAVTGLDVVSCREAGMRRRALGILAHNLGGGGQEKNASRPSLQCSSVEFHPFKCTDYWCGR